MIHTNGSFGRITDSFLRKPSVKKRKHTCANVFWSFMLNQVRQGILSYTDLMKQALASLSGCADGSNGKESGGGIAAIEYNSNSPPAQIIAVQPVFASTDMRVTAMGVGKRLLIVACLCMMLSTFSSCGGSNEPAPPVPPPPPPVKVDTVRYVDQTNLDKMLEAVSNMNKDKTYVIWTFQNGVLIPLYANETDAVRLNQLNDLSVIQPSKGVYNPNNAKFIPGNDKIILTDPLIDALVKQWKWNDNQGVKFDFNGNNIGFWINSGQSGKFTQEMLQKLFYTDARPVIIDKAADLDAKLNEAVALKKSGQQVMITLTGTWAMNAAQTNSFKLLAGLGIPVINNANIKVTYQHATKAVDLTGPWYAGNGNWTGNKIDLEGADSPNAFRQLPAIIANDTLLWMMNTAATVGKQNFIYNAVKNNQLINPMVGGWIKWDGYDISYYNKLTKTEDGLTRGDMDFSAGIDMDTYNGGNGGLQILMEALAIANKGITSKNDRDYYFPFIRNAAINVTKDPKYIGEHTDVDNQGNPIFGTKSNWTFIDYGDLRFVYDGISTNLIPNANLMFSTASNTTIKGKNIRIVIPPLYQGECFDPNGKFVASREFVLKNLAQVRVTIEATKIGWAYSEGFGWSFGEKIGPDAVFYLNVANTMTYTGK